jgi:poly-gamma-glutamate synthesis protein (capsule biosynthesis protein)
MNSNEIVLMAAGDVSPSRDDPPSIFRFCREVLRSADVLFGQLEAPLSDRGERAFTPQGQCRLPAKNITALTAEEGAGFDVMSFAGNHSMDFGEDAFFDTIRALTNAGIAVVGAGSTIKEARNPVVVERNGTKIGFLAYTSILYPGLEAESSPICCQNTGRSSEKMWKLYDPKWMCWWCHIMLESTFNRPWWPCIRRRPPI